MTLSEVIKIFVVLWAFIDPIGSIPVFLEATKQFDRKTKLKIARKATIIAGAVLTFFLVVGQFVLEGMDISLEAFQVSGGAILFIFSLTMIFGNSKPDEEVSMIKDYEHVTVFPIAIPSIASPGAIMGVVLLTDNDTYSILHQSITGVLMIVVLVATYLLLILSQKIHDKFGDNSISVLSKIMGLIIASVAVESMLKGIQLYFNIQH
jgi:multiple antibiotic resistance protein